MKATREAFRLRFNLRIVFPAIVTIVAVCWPGDCVRAAEGKAKTGKLDEYCRGIAVLSSQVANQHSISELLGFVETCEINFAVVDFAWITYHWPRTDTEAVERLCAELNKRGVDVAVMYRPRALRPTEAAIHFATDRHGEIARDHNELCFSQEDSKAWGVGWGTKLLEAVPSVNKVILYNLRTPCCCPLCREGQGKNHAAQFLELCRREWKDSRPDVQLGHVGMGIEYEEQVDFLCPFLSVIRGGESPLDLSRQMESLSHMKSKVDGKPVVPLAKICWSTATNNDTKDVANAIRLCEEQKSGFVLWYYGWIFHHPQRYDAKAIVTALGGDWDKMSKHFVAAGSVSSNSYDGPPRPSKQVVSGESTGSEAHRTAESQGLRKTTRIAPTPGNRPKKYTAAEVRDTDIEMFFDRIAKREKGYHTFAALWALTEKVRDGDAATRKRTVSRAIEIVQDPKEPLTKRWQCCYVLSGIGDPQAIPTLGQALSGDNAETLRSVAACALGAFDAEEARRALREAKESEKSSRVLDSISGALSGRFRKSAGRVALADESPPKLTFPYREEHVEKLPWPHEPPGLNAEEKDKFNRQVWVINDFPLYQADPEGNRRYFHGGFDIVADNGTKIYAMKNGWVKSARNSFVVIADRKDDSPCYGWAYGHLGNLQVDVGDLIKAGTWIGEIDFRGLPHIHLTKVFSEGKHWGTWSYDCPPNAHFTYVDQEPPHIKTPFSFFKNKSDTLIKPFESGVTTVGGEVDIVVGLRDGGLFAHSKESGFGDRLAVARIDYEITPVLDGQDKGLRFRSFDFQKTRIKKGYRGRTYGTELTKVVYKHWKLCESVRRSGDKAFTYYVITNCPKDEPPRELETDHRDYCWNTAERDDGGNPIFPNGTYEIKVTAQDFAGNQSGAVTKVRVAN